MNNFCALERNCEFFSRNIPNNKTNIIPADKYILPPNKYKRQSRIVEPK